MSVNRSAKLAIWIGAAVVTASLFALAAPIIIPLLPQQAQTTMFGTIDTERGTVDQLLDATGLAGSGQYGDDKVTHAAVDEEYMTAASIWPWDLPAGWGFPRNRGVPDTPGRHWNGMGVKAAFSTWATASLEAVRAGDLSAAEQDALLDEIERAYDILRAEGVLSDARFIEQAVEPLRASR